MAWYLFMRFAPFQTGCSRCPLTSYSCFPTPSLLLFVFSSSSSASFLRSSLYWNCKLGRNSSWAFFVAFLSLLQFFVFFSKAWIRQFEFNWWKWLEMILTGEVMLSCQRLQKRFLLGKIFSLANWCLDAKCNTSSTAARQIVDTRLQYSASGRKCITSFNIWKKAMVPKLKDGLIGKRFDRRHPRSKSSRFYSGSNHHQHY